MLEGVFIAIIGLRVSQTHFQHQIQNKTPFLEVYPGNLLYGFHVFKGGYLWLVLVKMISKKSLGQ